MVDAKHNDLLVRSPRLELRPSKPDDMAEVFEAITPSLTRYMNWEPPESLSALAEVWHARLPAIEAGTDFHMVTRLAANREFLGIVGLHGVGSQAPELGVWMKEAAQGNGFGREAVEAVRSWAARRFQIEAFLWPVAEQNTPSRRLAEALHGVVVGSAMRPKYNALIYRVPAP